MQIGRINARNEPAAGLIRPFPGIRAVGDESNGHAGGTVYLGMQVTPFVSPQITGRIV